VTCVGPLQEEEGGDGGAAGHSTQVVRHLVNIPHLNSCSLDQCWESVTFWIPVPLTKWIRIPIRLLSSVTLRMQKIIFFIFFSYKLTRRHIIFSLSFIFVIVFHPCSVST
jgi:hypothetical protein